MENQTSSDLNETNGGRPENSAATPADRADPVAELAPQLRGSVVTLKAAGLSEEEAFLVAARRLAEQVLREKKSGRENAGTFWDVAAFWIVAGLFLSLTLSSLGDVAALLVASPFVPRTFHGISLYAVLVWILPKFFLASLLVCLLCWEGTACSIRCAGLVRNWLQRPVLSMVGLAVVGLVAAFAPTFGFLIRLQLTRQITARNVSLGSWEKLSAQALWPVILAVVMVVLARRVARKSRHGSTDAISHK